MQPGSRKPNPALLKHVLKHATEHGVIPLDAGSWDSVQRLLPSVVISEALLDDAAGVLEAAIESFDGIGEGGITPAS